MAVLSEGNLTFIFKEPSQAIQYDNWSFFRNQFQSTCGSAKAVDMICIANNITWLIEIKDYRQHRRTKPMELGSEIAIKVRDTLAGLVAAKFNANDSQEKRFAKNALGSHLIKVVLHLEQPENQSRLFPKSIDVASVKQKLKKHLKAIDAHPSIVNQHDLKANMEWTVTG